ncbi:MAG: glutamine synthetase [Anaerolineaceae bacterium]|nr:glutamine synthetase [Anaerolineaceae bacterium]
MLSVKEVLSRVKEDNVKFVSFQFTDVSGSTKSVDAPISQLEGALEKGVWFDGSSIQGFTRIQESDMHLIIDRETYAVLPWSPEDMKRARFFCDIHRPDGTPYDGDPRGALKRMVAEMDKRGWVFNVGPEPEFFLFKRNGDATHPVPFDVGGYFDFSANDDAVNVRTELMEALDSMGLEIEVGHHEVAIGQHEIDFRFADVLKTADNVLTMKYTVKAIAAKHGLVASFMPKPMFGVNGSGMHCHQSLFTKDGENLFFDTDDEFNLSDLARNFIAGELKHAKGLAAVIAPTVNSYKRLVPGYEAPVYIGWAQTNRSALIRIPRSNQGNTAVRAELRCPDPSCNPYLAFTAMLASALDGIDNKLTPPDALRDVNIFDLTVAERKAKGIESLPGSLKEALTNLEGDSIIKNALGDAIYSSFKRAKEWEWDEFRTRVTDWEVERYLETV